MPNRYIANDAIKEIAFKQDVTGASAAAFVTGIDTRNYDAVRITTRGGNHTGSTLAFTATNDMEIRLQHSQDDVAANYEDVTASDVHGDATAALLQRFMGDLDDEAVESKVTWYRGNRRFLRVGLTRGSSSTPATATYTVTVEGLRFHYFA